MSFLLSTQITAQQYIEAVEKQDDIFAKAMEAIYTSLGINRDADQNNTIEASKNVAAKTTIGSYLDDVGNLIYFSNTIKKYGQTEQRSANKLQKIMIAHPVELLVNPDQVKNRFIQDLAEVCIAQKKEPSILTEFNISTPPDPILLARALRYEAINEANSRSMTSNKSSDGFYLLQPINEFRTIMGYDRSDITKGFWYKFLLRCKGENTFIDNDDDRYAYFAAYVYKKFADPSTGNLKETVLNGLISDSSSTSAIKYPRGLSNISHIPEPAVLDQPVISNGPTLSALLSKMLIGDIQFVVHLCYTITAAVSTNTFDSLQPSV